MCSMHDISEAEYANDMRPRSYCLVIELCWQLQGGAPSQPAKLSRRQQRDAGMARAAEFAALSAGAGESDMSEDAVEPERALAAVG